MAITQGRIEWLAGWVGTAGGAVGWTGGLVGSGAWLAGGGVTVGGGTAPPPGVVVAGGVGVGVCRDQRTMRVPQAGSVRSW
jgi:hypothetical protein